MKGLKDLAWKNDSKALWNILNRDHMNIISLFHYAPEAAFDLAEFKIWAKSRYGSVSAAYRIIDADRSGKVTFEEFSSVLKREGVPANLARNLRLLFSLLNDGAGGGGRVLLESEVVFLDTWQLPDYFWAEVDLEHTLAPFRSAIGSRSLRNPLIAWRRFFDKDGSMKVNYSEFATACKRLVGEGLTEAAPARGLGVLYRSIDRSCAGWISLRHWDADMYLLLSRFTSWAREQFGRVSKCVAAWEKKKNEGCGFKPFSRGIQPLGFTCKEVEELFEGLSMERVTYDEISESTIAGKVTQNELIFLDTWDADKQLEEEEMWERIAAAKMPHLLEVDLA